MTTKTLRLPAELLAAVRDVGATEHIGEPTALRKLLRLGYELHLAEQYRRGHVSLREVARRLSLPIGDALDLLQRLGVPGNVSAAETLHSLASLRQPPG
jgi:predicted HTH domain antitoxin